MISGKTKKELLDEILKFGNVYLSCLKIGVDRATYYRWKKTDDEFKGKACEAERMGRENICDVASHALMQNVKNRDQRAIEYVLNHNSEKYKQKQASQVVIVHKKELPPIVEQKTLEDLLDDYGEDLHQKALKLKEKLTMFGEKIPDKLDGSPIEDHELSGYEGYIRDWQRHRRVNKESIDATDIASLRLENSTSSEMPLREETYLDRSNTEAATLNNMLDTKHEPPTN